MESAQSNLLGVKCEPWTLDPGPWTRALTRYPAHEPCFPAPGGPYSRSTLNDSTPQRLNPGSSQPYLGRSMLETHHGLVTALHNALNQVPSAIADLPILVLHAHRLHRVEESSETILSLHSPVPEQLALALVPDLLESVAKQRRL
eukprot:2063281-Rhodomonas_salina.5